MFIVLCTWDEQNDDESKTKENFHELSGYLNFFLALWSSSKAEETIFIESPETQCKCSMINLIFFSYLSNAAINLMLNKCKGRMFDEMALLVS